MTSPGVCSTISNSEGPDVWLPPWLESLQLAHYIEQATRWCEEMGACDLDEVRENWDVFADDLQLTSTERERLGLAVASTETSPLMIQNVTVRNMHGECVWGPTEIEANVSIADLLGQVVATLESWPHEDVPSSRFTLLRSEIVLHPKILCVESGICHGEVLTLHDCEKDARLKQKLGCGATFGCPHYLITRELGRGATATVYECWRGQDRFAAKAMDLTRLRMQPRFEDTVASMKKEILILLKLRNSRIVQLHDVVESHEYLILIMEYMEGGSLFEYIVDHGCLSANEARSIFVQLIEGLKYIHSCDIIHRDLKPDNILLPNAVSPPNFAEVKLADFGNSKLIHDGYTHAVTVTGTQQYWAPEVDGSRGTRYDVSADLWSLGVVLYVMLTGQLPFGRDDAKTHVNFRGSREINELICGLIHVKPHMRMKLDQCLECAWVRAWYRSSSTTSLSTVTPKSLSTVTSKSLSTVPSKSQSTQTPTDSPADCKLPRREVRLRLPQKPEDPASFKKELTNYSCKYKIFVELQLLDLIIDLPACASDDVLTAARNELARIVNEQVPELSRRTVCNAFDTDICAGLDEDVAALRIAERESLESFYGEEFEVVSSTEWLVRLRHDVALRIALTPEYPRSDPPMPIIECPHVPLPADFVQQLRAQWLPGDFCALAWAEMLRELIEPKETSSQELPTRPNIGDCVMIQFHGLAEVISHVLTEGTFEGRIKVQYRDGSCYHVHPSQIQDPGRWYKSSESYQSLTVIWAQRELEHLEPGETKVFPASLNAFQRFVLHRVCEALGWLHESHDLPWKVESKQGPVKARQLHVTRPRKGAPSVKNVDIQLLGDAMPWQHTKNPDWDLCIAFAKHGRCSKSGTCKWRHEQPSPPSRASSHASVSTPPSRTSSASAAASGSSRTSTAAGLSAALHTTETTAASASGSGSAGGCAKGVVPSGCDPRTLRSGQRTGSKPEYNQQK